MALGYGDIISDLLETYHYLLLEEELEFVRQCSEESEIAPEDGQRLRDLHYEVSH